MRMLSIFIVVVSYHYIVVLPLHYCDHVDTSVYIYLHTVRSGLTESYLCRHRELESGSDKLNCYGCKFHNLKIMIQIWLVLIGWLVCPSSVFIHSSGEPISFFCSNDWNCAGIRIRSSRMVGWTIAIFFSLNTSVESISTNWTK